MGCRFIQHDEISNSIDFVIHVWLMLRFNSEVESRLLLERVFEWDPAQTLVQALLANFPTMRPEGYDVFQQPGHQHDRIVTPREDPERDFTSLFTLRDMEILGGFVIEPTDNILQHLYIQKFPDRKFRVQVFVFFHAAMLLRLRDDPNQGCGCPTCTVCPFISS